MPKCQLLFSAVFGFRNPSNEIFSELDEINAQGPILPQSFQKSKEERKGSRGGPTPPRRGARRPRVWAPRASLDSTSSPSYSLRRENPITESHDTEKVPETPPSPIPSQGIQEISFGTLPERGIITRRTLHHHDRLRTDV